MTRVAVVIDSLGLGGAERLLVTLAQHAPHAGLEVSVLSLRDVDSPLVAEQLEAAGTEIRTVPTRHRHHLTDPWRLARLARELRELRPDVVNTHLGTSHVLGVAAARLTSLPVVGTLHSIHLPGGGLRQRSVITALRRADAIVAVGDAVARTHHSLFAPRPITVVPNPVDITACTTSGPAVAMLRRDLLGEHDGPLLLSVGRLEPPKGHLVLIDALRLVVDRHPETVLAIAGEGSLVDAVSERVRRLGLEGHVQLLGARRDVPQLLAAADVFVNPSHWEGLPLAVLEAMASCTPVVATDVGDVRQVLRGAGVTVPPDQSVELATGIESLVTDPARRARLATRGRQIVADHYDPDRWVERLQDVYGRVCHTGSRRVA